MDEEEAEAGLSGHCLCGAVRWRAQAAPRNVHHCHCSMWRRWTGAAFATLVWFARTEIVWQGEAPAIHRSSPIAARSHCPRCGTPLALAYDARDDIALTAGSLDDPARVTPRHNYGVEGRLPWSDAERDLPGKPTRERW